MNANHVKRMMELFRGLSSGHGRFIPVEGIGKKQVGKCSTLREDVTLDKWQDHLEGKIGIGIIPIDEHNQCNWAVIDIDQYPIDYQQLLLDIEQLPFVVCMSKSQGAHLFLFLDKPTPARKIREYIRNQMSTMGMGNHEIFPKQDEINSKRGDVGNWLNMPYFGNTRRCVVRFEDEILDLDLEEFLDYAESKKISLEVVEANMEKIDYDSSPIKDGPPCLQILSIKGFPNSTRNLALYNLGVYAQKAFPDKWERYVEAYNRTFFVEPLKAREVETLVKSLDKKSYSYKCYEEPICSHCNAKLCRTRKFGIHNASSMPIITNVTKIHGDESMWFIDVEGGRLELMTEELYDQRRFKLACMNSLNILPAQLNAQAWATFVQDIIDKAIVVSDENMFKRTEIPELFYRFMIDRVTERQTEIQNGRVIYYREQKEIRWQMEAFINYLKFKKANIDRGWLVMYFKSRGVRTGVAKTQERRSYRYTCMELSDEEETDLKDKLVHSQVL